MNENLHKGHRARLKRRFRNFGADSLENHELLELLLFYALPRGDTNELAHALLDRFGSLYKLFNAPYDALQSVDGVGENTALLLKLIPQLWKFYDLSRTEYVLAPKASTDVGIVLTPYFRGLETEVVYMMTLTSKSQLIRCSKMFEGTVGKVHIFTRRIIEAALADSASGVILAHNHPNGDPVPSSDDIAVTKRIADALYHIDVKLLDHIVVAGDDYVSMRKCGMM